MQVSFVLSPRVVAFGAPEELRRRLVCRTCLYHPVVCPLIFAFLAFLAHDWQIGLIVLYNLDAFFLCLCRYLRLDACIFVSFAAAAAYKITVFRQEHPAAFITEFHLINRQ